MQLQMKVVIAGTTFGQFYFEALKYIKPFFPLAGILANGSERSRVLAKREGVPLYTSVNQLPDDIDLACVVIRSSAMGGSGTEIAVSLLERGINVIQEQPVHYKDLMQCFKIAKKHNVFFHTGDLYVHLPVIRRFIASAKELIKQQQLLYIEASCAAQVSFPLIDVLSKIMPSMRPFRIKHVDRESGPFHIVTADMNNVPAIFLIHNEMNPEDPNNFMHLLQRITLGTVGGRLCLYDTHGPVIWHNCLYVPTSLGPDCDLPPHLYEKSRVGIDCLPEKTYEEILRKDWPSAITNDFLVIRDLTEGVINRNVTASREILVSEIWHTLTNQLGYAALKDDLKYEAISASKLVKAAACEEDFFAKSAENTKENLSLHTCTERGDREIIHISKQQVDDFVTEMDNVICRTMLTVLQKNGCLLPQNPPMTLDKIVSKTKTLWQYDYILERWLAFLKKHKFVQENGNTYSGCEIVPAEDIPQMWKNLRQNVNSKIVSPLVIDYLIRNVMHLEELMRGKVKAATLLFHEGKTDCADALYSDTATAKFLNQSVAEAVARFAHGKTKLKILEVGAGTGATTVPVAIRLQSIASQCSIEYIFSDVSDYFLNIAKEKCRAFTFIKEFRQFDINQNIMRQGIEYESQDVIIAAGVLNNAADTNHVIDGLLELLKKDGILIITEPTGEFAEILISQVFMAVRPSDERLQTKTTFLTDEQWMKILKSRNVSEVISLPESGHKLEALRQRLYILVK